MKRDDRNDREATQAVKERKIPSADKVAIGGREWRNGRCKGYGERPALGRLGGHNVPLAAARRGITPAGTKEARPFVLVWRQRDNRKTAPSRRRGSPSRKSP